LVFRILILQRKPKLRSTKPSTGPHAARGPRVGHSCDRPSLFREITSVPTLYLCLGKRWSVVLSAEEEIRPCWQQELCWEFLWGSIFYWTAQNNSSSKTCNFMLKYCSALL